MRGMHYAVDQLDLDTIFPVAQTTPNSSSIPTSSDVQKCLDVLKDSELNPFQLQAITSILDSSCLKVSLPHCLIGYVAISFMYYYACLHVFRSLLWFWVPLVVARLVH